MKKILLVIFYSVLSLELCLAQTYPDKPVKIVVPYTPGGATDTLARSIVAAHALCIGEQFVFRE